MTLPTNHTWPQSLKSSNAVEEFAMMLDGWRSQFSGCPTRDWSRVPQVQKIIYRDLALRLLMKLGPLVEGANDDSRLRATELSVARSLERIK